jgi:tetratricopeptide (TPR) repeat protein
MHPDFTNRLALAERMLGNFERARVLLQTALDEERRRGFMPAVAYEEICFSYLELEAGELDRAAVHLRIADEMLATDSAETVNRLDIAELQAEIAFARGKPVEADKIASRVLALFEERKIDDGRNERFWLIKAAALNLLGRPAEAEKLAQKALDRRNQRKAPKLELAAASAQVTLSQYLQAPTPDKLALLRRLVEHLDDPQMRIDRTRFVRWFAANHLRP